MTGPYRLVFSPEAERQLVSIFRYIERAASATIAQHFTDAVVEHCHDLRTFPHRGTARDDLRPGLRVVGFRRRVSIAFAIEEETVIILGVFYGGQNYEDELLRSRNA